MWWKKPDQHVKIPYVCRAPAAARGVGGIRPSTLQRERLTKLNAYHVSPVLPPCMPRWPHPSGRCLCRSPIPHVKQRGAKRRRGHVLLGATPRDGVRPLQTGKLGDWKPLPRTQHCAPSALPPGSRAFRGSDRYAALCDDFGPFNLGTTHHFCDMLAVLLSDPALARKRLVFWVAPTPRDLTNGIYLMGAFLTTRLGASPAEAPPPPPQPPTPPTTNNQK